MNRAVAVANLHGPCAGLEAIAAMEQRERLESHYLLHAVVGELHWRLNEDQAAAESFRSALHFAQVGPEQLHLTRMLERSAARLPDEWSCSRIPRFVSALIREATVDDAAAISDLASELGYPATAEVMRSRLTKILGRGDHLVLVAMNDDLGVVHGWIHAHAAHLLESGQRVDIVGLVVAQSVRRTGCGRLLVEKVELWARALECGAVAVCSNVKRVESHLFYPAIGYKNVKTQVSYRKWFQAAS